MKKDNNDNDGNSKDVSNGEIRFYLKDHRMGWDLLFLNNLCNSERYSKGRR